MTAGCRGAGRQPVPPSRRAAGAPPQARRSSPGGWAAWRSSPVVALLVLAWIGQMFLRSPFLAVSHLVVRGNARLSTGEVQTLLDGLSGQNILRVDFDDYRQQLMDSPWVADATMWRVLPSTVGVQIVERVADGGGAARTAAVPRGRRGVIIDEFGPQYQRLRSAARRRPGASGRRAARRRPTPRASR